MASYKRMRQSTDSNEFRQKRTLSKTLKASLISSSLSVSFIFRAIMVRNSGKSIVPLPTRIHKKEMTRLTNNQPLSGSMRCVPHVRRGRRSGTLDLTVSIHLIDHVLEFSLGGVLSQRAHDSSELFGGDGAISVLVEQ